MLLNNKVNTTVFIVDDDEALGESVRWLIESVGLKAEIYDNAISFLNSYDNKSRGCLILDVRMPEISGLILQEELQKKQINIPIIFITGHGDIPMAVQAMKAGAVDFLTKPFNDQALLDSIHSAIQIDAKQYKETEKLNRIVKRIKKLTPREFEVMELIVDGCSNKSVASHLKIATKTVELHRAKIMDKMETKSLAELVKFVLMYRNYM